MTVVRGFKTCHVDLKPILFVSIRNVVNPHSPKSQILQFQYDFAHTLGS